MTVSAIESRSRSKQTYQSVDPVQKVESPVTTQRKHVVGVESIDETASILCLFVDDNKLGNNGNSFKIDGESPQDFKDCEVLVDEESKDEGRDDEEENVEVVVDGVVRLVDGVFVQHHVHNAHGPKEIRQRVRKEW